MRRVRIAVIAATLLVAPVAWFVTSEFLVYQPGVSRIVRQVRSDDPPISRQAADVFRQLDGPVMPWIVARALLQDLAPQRVTMAEWHLRGGLWQTLLPLRLRGPELLRLYAHYMVFESGRGISRGAAEYFHKSPSELSTGEAVALVAISRSPRANSPTRNPARFREVCAGLPRKCDLPPN